MELRICKKCNCEKPESDFRVNRIGKNGLPQLRGDCRPCEWLSRSDEMRERKRERDRERIKRPEHKAKMAEYQSRTERREWRRHYMAEYNERCKTKRFEARLGRACFFMVRECKKCGKVDSIKKNPPKGRGVEYCPPCAVSVNLRGFVRPKTLHSCIDCSKTFWGAYNSRRCSICAYRHAKTTYGADHKVRSAYYGVEYQVIAKEVVFDRDGWTCYLCGCEVFKSNVYHPKQATIDCVIPMSKGGGYTYDNTRTCCMMCNASKSDSILLNDTGTAKGYGGGQRS